MVVVPILGSFFLALQSVTEKIGLRQKKMDSSHFAASSFLAAVLIMIPLMFFFWQFNPEVFQTKYVWAFIGIVAFAVVGNLFYFYAMKWEKLSNLEPVHLLYSLFVFILASIFFESERNLEILIPAIIAGLALIFSHVRKHHFEFDKYMVAGVFASLFFAAEGPLIKIILPFISPITLYFVRGIFVLAVLSLIFRPKFLKETKGNERKIVAATGITWVAYNTLEYYGFATYGLVYTTLVLMLSPVLVYLFAWKILKEKPGWRNIVASAVILGSILYATFSL